MVKKLFQQPLPFEFRASFGRHDFIVGNSNKEALQCIDKLSEWEQHGLIIVGPKLSGKSHLISVLKANNFYTVKEAYDVNNECIDIFNLKNLVIENIENVTNHKFFLHIINILKEKKFKLVLTSTKDIKSLDIDLKDLKSRLLTFPQTNILLPTDDILYGLTIKLSKDLGIFINEVTAKFIINHSERSYKSVNDLIKKLNDISLQRKKNITIPLVKEVLSKTKIND